MVGEMVHAARADRLKVVLHVELQQGVRVSCSKHCREILAEDRRMATLQNRQAADRFG
ncbi:hypothetical protein D3C87_2136090 [compost metagenome]